MSGKTLNQILLEVLMNCTKHLSSSLTASCVARFMICWVCRLYFSGLVCSVLSLDECLIKSTPWKLTVMQWEWRCSHADHVYYLDDDWHCHARRGPGHMTNHGIFAYKTLLSATLHLFWVCCFGDGGATCMVYNPCTLVPTDFQLYRKMKHKF